MHKTVFIVLIYLLGACTANTEKTVPEITSDQELEIRYAENFKLYENANSFQIHVLNPETAEVESTHEIDKQKEYKIISLSSTLNGMLSVLKGTDRIVGISSIDHVHDSIIQQLFKEEKIEQFGGETNYSLERIIASDADIIFYNGYGKSFPNYAKLEKLGFILIPVYDWRESHPLGKAEWIKMLGAILNNTTEANSYFENIEHEYAKLVEITKGVADKPTVLSGNLIGDIWFAPAGESYVAHLINDAGGDYVYKESDGTGSIERSIEEILVDNKTTELWINPGYTSKVKIHELNPHVKRLHCFENIYCYSPNMTLFWERSAIEPHRMLGDLISIFHPGLLKEKDLYFYTKIH